MQELKLKNVYEPKEVVIHITVPKVEKKQKRALFAFLDEEVEDDKRNEC